MSPAVLSLAFSLSVLAQTDPLSGGVASPERQKQLLEEINRHVRSREVRARLREEANRLEESRQRTDAKQSARYASRHQIYEEKTDSPSSDVVGYDTATIVSAIMLAIILMGFFIIYWLPSRIALFRNHHNTAAIVALNLFLGWTFLGWVAALCWALTQVKSNQYHVRIDEGQAYQGKGEQIDFLEGQDPSPKVEPPQPTSIDLGVKL